MAADLRSRFPVDSKQSNNCNLTGRHSPRPASVLHLRLASRLQSSWPLRSTKDTYGKSQHEHYEHYQSDNFGFGPVLDEYVGMYKSNHYQLYTIIMGKLRIHPRRTFNRENATLFIIPYDIGVANQWRKSDGTYLPHSGNACPEATQVAALIKQELAHSKHGGHDHLIINSLFNMFAYHCLEVFEACANCTVIGCDVPNHNQHPVFKEFRSENRPFPRRWYGVPFPSAFHWHEHIQLVPWHASHRNITVLASIWASVSVQQAPAVKLRKALLTQCNDRPTECYNVNLANRHHNQCYKSGGDHCGSMTGLEAYNASVFCLQPPGDLMSRKGVFDSFLTGCIPVINTLHALSKSYPWWFPANGFVEDNVTVHVSHFTKVNPRFNSIDALRAIPRERVRAMQKKIEDLGYLLQYAKPPQAFAPYIGHAGGPGEIYRQEDLLYDKSKATWKPPFRDALDVILDSLAGIAVRYARTGVVPPEEAPNAAEDLWTAYWASG